MRTLTTVYRPAQGDNCLAIAQPQAQQRGFTTVSLLCFEQNQGALRLYQRHGFSTVQPAAVVPHPLIHPTGNVLIDDARALNSMLGETSLAALLRSMQPALSDQVFVFCAVSREQLGSLPLAPPLGAGQLPADTCLSPIGLFFEAEAVTLIVPQLQAQQLQLAYSYPCRLITLKVHSSLAAVGFLAAVTQALAAQGISVNPVSAYYHDHLFVDAAQAEAAIACLKKLSAAAAP